MYESLFQIFGFLSTSTNDQRLFPCPFHSFFWRANTTKSIRLRLPKGGLGREYIIIQLYIKGKGPFDFMVDSGLTTELITPRELSSSCSFCGD